MRDELDVITLRGLTARGHHGVLPFEREGTQPFSADVSLWVDTRAAASSDDIDATVSYADIAEEAVAVLTGPSVYLLETLAQRIADVALAHPQVQGVEVTIHKPMAPLRQQFSDVSVTIRRGAALESPVGAAVPSSSRTPRPVPLPADEGVPAPAVGASEPDRPPLPGPPSRRRAGRIRVDDSAWTPVVLALGGNLGDVPVTLASAVEALTDLEGVRVDAVSPLVRTAPVLEEGQAAQDDYWNAVVLARTSLAPASLLEATAGIEESLGRVRHEHWGARTVDIDIVQVEGVTSDEATLTLPHPRAARRAFVLVPWALADPSAVLAGVGPVAELARKAPDLSGVRDAVEDWLEDPRGIQEDSDAHLSDAPLPDDAGTGTPAEPTTQAEPPAPAPETLPASTPAAPGRPGPRRGPRWVPVRRGVSGDATPVPAPAAPAPSAPRQPDTTALHEEDAARTEAPAVHATGERALPAWDFGGSHEPRIVDDARDLTPDGPRPAERGTHGKVHRRSVLDPDLPPSVPTGPLEQDPATTTSILRGLTVRPSVTGQQPVTRHRGRRERA